MSSINKNLFYRYEPYIDNGVLIIFFTKKNKIFELTEPYYIYLKSIENNLNFEQIYLKFKNKYPELDRENINKSLDYIDKKLHEIGVLI